MVGDKILNKFTLEIFKECKRAPMIVVYKNTTKDYPNRYVARLFDVDRPTKYVLLRDTYNEIVKEIPYGMVSFTRNEGDDPKIIETYM